MLSDTSNDFAPRLEGFYPCSSLPRMVNSQLIGQEPGAHASRSHLMGPFNVEKMSVSMQRKEKATPVRSAA